MKCGPPVLHGRDWDWPSDGSEEAWPEYLGRMPVRRLFHQVESRDTVPQHPSDHGEYRRDNFRD